MPVSDDEIIEKVRNGGKRHYACLVDRYKDRAFTFALRILKNREDAEEAVQDAFVRAYNALEKFEGTAKFGTWFYRITYNTCLSKLGTKRAAFESIQYDENEEYDVLSREHSDALAQLEHDDMIMLVKKIIDTLSPKYSSVLSLFYFQELSHEEICEVTQLPLGTVKAHLFRARVLVQERFQQIERKEKSTV